jgi:hypothetical protein
MFSIDLKELRKNYEAAYPKLVEVSWNYSQENELLKITLKKEVINAKIILLSDDKTIFEEKVIGKLNEFSTTFSTPKRTILLIVDDDDALMQQSFTLTLDPRVDLTKENESIEDNDKTFCPEKICTGNLVCSGQTYLTDEGACCPTECISLVESGESNLIPNILFLSIIIFIVAIFVVSSTFKKVKK